MLFFGYFSCLIVVFTSVAIWLIGSFNYSTLERHHYHHPRPTIDQTITLEELAPLHLQVTKEASTAKDDVSPVKHHKRKVLARQRNNYEPPGYGNALGYAEDRNGPKGLFFNR